MSYLTHRNKQAEFLWRMALIAFVLLAWALKQPALMLLGLAVMAMDRLMSKR